MIPERCPQASPGCQRCPWSLVTIPGKHFGEFKDGKCRRRVLHTHLRAHTHSQALLGVCSRPFPWNQSPLPGPSSPVMPHWLCFSRHAEKWKPVPLTRGKDTVSIKPEKHNLLRACFQFQAMPWKGQLIWIFRKSKIIKWEGLGILGLFFFPFDEENSGLLLTTGELQHFLLDLHLLFKKEDVLEQRLRIYSVWNQGSSPNHETNGSLTIHWSLKTANQENMPALKIVCNA